MAKKQVIIDPDFEEMKAEWYNIPCIKYEMVKTMIHRETAVIHVTNPNMTLRCLKINAVKFFDKNNERYDLVNEHYNIYSSLAKFPLLPMFSFNRGFKKQQQEEFNKKYKDYINEFDLLIDVDNEDLGLAFESAKRVKAILDEYKVPYWCQFSLSGDTPVMIKSKGNIEILKIKKAVERFKKGECFETLSLDNNYNLTFSKVYDTIEHIDELYNVYYDGCNIPIKITKHHSLMFLDKDLNIVKKKITDDLTDCYLISFNGSKYQSKKNALTIDVPYIYNNKKANYKLKITPELMEMAGFYLGDGFLGTKSHEVCFSVNINKSHITKKIRKAVINLPNLFRKYMPINVRENFNNPNVRKISFSNAIILQFLKQNFKKLAHSKELPCWVFNLEKNMLLHY